MSNRDSNLDDSDEDSDQQLWINRFFDIPMHKYYVEVPENFITDDFNLTGLSALVPYYKKALELILDIDPEEEWSDEAVEECESAQDSELEDDGLWKERRLPTFSSRPPDEETLEKCAFQLYGLIHQRFLLTRNGLRLMAERYRDGDFGECPRVYCTVSNIKSNLLPCGSSDEVMDRPGRLYMYCPRCKDIYTPSNMFKDVDGTHFGASYLHLLVLNYSDNVLAPRIYEQRIFGFKVSKLSNVGPRMQWLRIPPHTNDDDYNDLEKEDYDIDNGDNVMIGEAVEGFQENDPSLTRLADQTKSWQLGAVLRRWL